VQIINDKVLDFAPTFLILRESIVQNVANKDELLYVGLLTNINELLLCKAFIKIVFIFNEEISYLSSNLWRWFDIIILFKICSNHILLIH
jgi:hypothetical protein